MMQFFHDIDQFKEFIGGAVNSSTDERNLGPVVANAAHEFIIPYLTENFYYDLLDKWQDDNLNTEEEKLLKHLQRSLAHFAVVEFAAVGSVQLSDSGLTRQESEHQKSAYKYQEENLTDKMRHYGYLHMERLLRHLVAEITDFPLFSSEAEDEFQSYKNIVPGFTNFSIDIKGSYGKNISRETLETMKHIIADIEQFAIRATIGDELYDSLYEKTYFNFLPGVDAPTDEEKKAIRIIRKATSALAISEAIKANLVQLQGEKVVSVSYRGTRLTDTNATPPDGHLNARINQAEISSNRHIIDLVTYIEKNESIFPLYQPHTYEAPDHQNQELNPAVAERSRSERGNQSIFQL